MASLIANWGESELNRARRLLKKRLREDHAPPDERWIKTVRYQFPGNPVHLLMELFKDLMKEPEFATNAIIAPAAAPAVAATPTTSVAATWSTDDDDFIRSLIEESNGKVEPKVIDAACALFPARTRAQVEDRFKLMAVTPLVAPKEHRVGRMENNYSNEERKLLRDLVIEHYNPEISYRHFAATYLVPLFKKRSESGLVQRAAKIVAQLKEQGYKFPVPKGFVPKSAKAEQSRLPEPPVETPPAPAPAPVSGRALPRLMEPNVDYPAVIVRVKDNGLIVDVTVNENRIYQGYVPESQIWHHAHHYLLDDWFDQGDWVTVRYYGRNPNTTLGQLPPGDKRISGGYLFSIKAANASPVVPKQRTPMPEIAHEEPPTPTPPPVAEPAAPAPAPASQPTPPPITATVEPAATALTLRVGDRPPLAPAVEHIQRLAKELSDQVVGMAARLTQSEDVIGEALAAIERFDVAHAREILRKFKGDAQA